MPRRLLPFSTACVLAFSTIGATVWASPQNVVLNFSSLPSAQGFTYTPSGSHAGAIESSIFSVSGGVMTQNSIGQGFGVSGGSIFYVKSGATLVTSTETKQLRVTARCTQVEGSGGGANGEQGFCFGFTTGASQYDVSITPTKVYSLGPSGTIAVAGTYDNSTTFHNWVLEYTPPSSFKIYRDGVQIHSGSGGFAVAANRVFIGDGTGGANAHAEVSAFQYIQDLTTSAQAKSWGRVKSIYR